MNKTHSETFVVRGTDCDMFSRMRLDMLFIAMQECGEQHALQLGFGYDAMLARNLFFVLSRIHVRITRMPRAGETVVHTTWPAASNRFFCPRYHVFTLEDGTPLACAGALWVMLDTSARKIVSPLSVDLRFPDNSDIPAPIDLPMRAPLSADDGRIITRTPVFSEFDVNGHVNNTKYMAWLCDSLGTETLKGRFISDLVASYEHEIRSEAPLTLSISCRDGHFSFLVAGEDCPKHFTASGTLSSEE